MPDRMRAALQRKAERTEQAVKEARQRLEPTEQLPTQKATKAPRLGAVVQLAKETGKSRAECKSALIQSNNVYDDAKWLLCPEAKPVDAQSACAIAGVFEPCAKFAGGRAGWIYKSGVHGIGYYCDTQPVRPVPSKG